MRSINVEYAFKVERTGWDGRLQNASIRPPTDGRRRPASTAVDLGDLPRESLQIITTDPTRAKRSFLPAIFSVFKTVAALGGKMVR